MRDVGWIHPGNSPSTTHCSFVGSCVCFFFSAIHKCILINILFPVTFTESPISIPPRSLRRCHWWPVFICLCLPDFLPVAQSEPHFLYSTGCSWFHSCRMSFPCHLNASEKSLFSYNNLRFVSKVTHMLFLHILYAFLHTCLLLITARHCQKCWSGGFSLANPISCCN